MQRWRRLRILSRFRTRHPFARGFATERSLTLNGKPHGLDDSKPETILELSRRIGQVHIPADCEKGSCKTCTVRVFLDGDSSDEQFDGGTRSSDNYVEVLACQEPAAEGLIVEVATPEPSATKKSGEVLGPGERRATYSEAKAWQLKQAEEEKIRREKIKKKRRNQTMEERLEMARKWQEVTGIELPEVDSDDDLDWDSEFSWDDDPHKMAARLIAKFRSENPDGMRKAKLMRLVRELPGFTGPRKPPDESVLERISEAWKERWQEEFDKVVDDNLSNYEP